MVLEQFIIDADIIWDQVGKTFFENPEAKPGRIMRVQVVNAGVVEDLTGYTLNLGWTSVRDPSKFGLDAFDDVDITKGIFEIEYTSGMLTNIGPLNASLQLVPPGEGRPIESNNFKLTVKNSAINPAAIQGETSFSTLENALVEVNGWNARIDVVEQEFKDRADALDGAYPVRLTAAEQSVAAIEAQVDLLNRGLGETMPTMASLLAAYPTGDTRDHIVAGNIAEVDTLTVTGVPTTAGNVTVTLNGVAVNVPVTVGVAEVASLLVTAVPTVAGNVTINLNGVPITVALDPAVQTTTDLVAAAIRAAIFAGWTTGGTGSTITFTATAVGTKTDATYSPGTTGATGTMTTTTQGVAAATTTIVATAIRAAVFAGWTTGGTGAVVTFTATTVGTRTAPIFSGGTTGTTGAFVRSAIGEAANFHRYFWNGAAWTDGGIYQAIEVTNESVTPDKTNFLKLILSNLFNKSKTTTGKYMSGGLPTTSINWSCSDYILLEPGYYSLSGYTGWINFFSLSMIYDPSKDTLPSVLNRVLQITEKCYMRFSFVTEPSLPQYNNPETLIVRSTNNSSADDILKFNFSVDGSAITENTIEGESLKMYSVQSNRVASKVINPRHFKPSLGQSAQSVFAEFIPELSLVTSGSVDISGIITANASYYVTSYLEILPETKYFFRKGYPYTGSIYNSNKEYISSFGNTGGITDNLEITTPSNAVYIRYNGRLDNLSVGIPNILVQSDSAPLDWTDITYEVEIDWLRTKVMESERQAIIAEANGGSVSASSIWAGKSFVSLGDSITAQDGVAYSQGDVGAIARGYQTVIKETLGFASYLNAGASGRPMADGTVNGVGTVTTGLAVNYAGYDLTIIAAGTNDFKLNVPLGNLGAIGDTVFDRNTFYGAYRTLIEYILTQKPTERIVLFTPLQRDNSGYDVNYTNSAGVKLIDIVGAIHNIGKMYGQPVCDMYANSGITKFTLSTYLMDGLHPNDLGYARMGGYASKFIENIGL